MRGGQRRRGGEVGKEGRKRMEGGREMKENKGREKKRRLGDKGRGNRHHEAMT